MRRSIQVFLQVRAARFRLGFLYRASQRMPANCAEPEAYLEDCGKERVQDIGRLDARDYLEAAKAKGLSTAALKQHMAAIRMLFDHLVTGGVLEHNPALSANAPREMLGEGKTPVLAAEEHRLPRERRYVGEGAPDGGACVDPHHAALRRARRPRDAG